MWSAWAQRAHDELHSHGVDFTGGFRPDEIHACEQELGIRLPPELSTFLAVGVPVSERWARWAEGPSAVAEGARKWLDDAFTFDVRQNGYWHDHLGPRPATDEAAIEVALAAVHAAPMLVPIYAHRFLVTEPAAGLRPVLSVWQPTDAIIYGKDLADYLHREFGITRPSWAADNVDEIPVWGDLLYIFGDPA